jgi:hypothetical protein
LWNTRGIGEALKFLHIERQVETKALIERWRNALFTSVAAIAVDWVSNEFHQTFCHMAAT